MIIVQNHDQFLHIITFLFVENVCMQDEVVLRCPYKQSIGITNILYNSKWNDFGWKSFDPIFCRAWTHTWNDCKSSISYKHLQDQCMWEDTCTVVMDYNPCWSETLLYATIYYKCIDTRYESVVPYPLIKYYDNRVPPTTSTQNPEISTTHLHHKKDDDDDNGDGGDDDNESQSSKSLKIGLGTALGITSIIAVIALICILKSRRNKHEQRPSPTPCSNHLTYEYDHGFQNPSAYQISASNPGYSLTMLDRVDTASDINYALPSYEEAVGNMYEEVNCRTPRAAKGPQ
ncbi:unnamed protein product [Mytilus coruscus]|uniref:SUEL-type lectin domain-containing protein n=1 Tax=Mytilus coruscus TaxID=42192 RepID=A0A6J8DKE7_MYTCO|nr:unnamed protein product [Mytilus coruscus]